MHNLFPEGLTLEASNRWNGYQMLTRDARFPPTTFGTIYTTYSSSTKKSQREAEYSQWHDARYAALGIAVAPNAPSATTAASSSQHHHATIARSHSSGPLTLQRTPSSTPSTPSFQRIPSETQSLGPAVMVIPPSPIARVDGQPLAFASPATTPTSMHRPDGFDTPRYQTLPTNAVDPPNTTPQQLLSLTASHLLAQAAAGAPPVHSTQTVAPTSSHLPFQRTVSTLTVPSPSLPQTKPHALHHPGNDTLPIFTFYSILA
jgi:hypothetical protein